MARRKARIVFGPEVLDLESADLLAAAVKALRSPTGVTIYLSVERAGGCGIRVADLADITRCSSSTMNGYLRLMMHAGMLYVRNVGRHRYYSLVLGSDEEPAPPEKLRDFLLSLLPNQVDSEQG